MSTKGSEDHFPMRLSMRMRTLERRDYDHQFLELLAELTEVGHLTRAAFEQRLDMFDHDELQDMVVVEEEGERIVCAAGTLVIEQKFIHECGRVGHLEDLVVRKLLRRKGLGSRVVSRIMELARLRGCSGASALLSPKLTTTWVKRSPRTPRRTTICSSIGCLRASLRWGWTSLEMRGTQLPHYGR